MKRPAPQPGDVLVASSNDANSSGVDCLMGFDLLVAAATPTASAPDRSRTIVVGSVTSTPTGAMVAHPTTPDLDVGGYGRLDEVSRPPVTTASSTPWRWPPGCSGCSTTANIPPLGVAVQVGVIVGSPLGGRAGDRAERGRRRPQRRGVPMGPPMGGVPRRRRAGGGHRHRAGTQDDRRRLIDRWPATSAATRTTSGTPLFLTLSGVAQQAERRVDPASTAFTAPSPVRLQASRRRTRTSTRSPGCSWRPRPAHVTRRSAGRGRRSRGG